GRGRRGDRRRAGDRLVTADLEPGGWAGPARPRADRAGLRVRRPGRRLLRLLSRPAGGAARSDRGASLRVTAGAPRAAVPEGSLKSYRKELWFETPGRRAFINITPDVTTCLGQSGVREGLVLVNAMHITASVFINDDEPGLHRDFE